MTPLVGGGNAILLLLSGMAIAGSLVIAFVATRQNKKSVARTFVGGAAIIAMLYGGGVIAASAASSEETLPAGETKWFCGFYLDCHLGLSIARSERITEIPSVGGAIKASGVFHVLTVRLHNSAINPNVDMLLYKPDARIVDATGHEYTRSEAAEAAIASTGRAPSLGDETTVKHEPIEATIVFDLPAKVQAPRLKVSEGWIFDRVIELGLINDETSILHKRTYMALDGGDSRRASSPAQ